MIHKYVFLAFALLVQIDAAIAKSHIISYPTTPKEGDDVTLIFFDEEDFAPETTIEFKVLGVADSTEDKHLISRSLVGFSRGLKSNYDLNMFKTFFKSEGNFDMYKIAFEVYLKGELIERGNYYINLKPHGKLRPLSSFENSIRVALVACEDLSKQSLSATDYLTQKAGARAILELIGNNSVLRKNYSRFSFYVDNSNVVRREVVVDRHIFEVESLRYEKSFPHAIVILHDTLVHDYALRHAKYCTSEYHCSGSLIHEISHLLFNLTDEYHIHRNISKYKKFNYTPNHTNLFETTEQIEDFNNEHNCNLSVRGKRVRKYFRGLDSLNIVKSDIYFKLCKNECVMDTTVCGAAEYGAACSAIVSSKLAN